MARDLCMRLSLVVAQLFTNGIITVALGKTRYLMGSNKAHGMSIVWVKCLELSGPAGTWEETWVRELDRAAGSRRVQTVPASVEM